MKDIAQVMDEMLDRIMRGGDSVFYKTQQLDDEDLTNDCKRDILSHLYGENKSVFLQRYSRLVPVLLFLVLIRSSYARLSFVSFQVACKGRCASVPGEVRSSDRFLPFAASSDRRAAG